MRSEDLAVHLKEERYTGGKTKIICSGGKFRHILNSSEKVFYGGDTNSVILLVNGLKHRP